MTAIFKKRHPQIGARPGTLVISPDSPQPRVHAIQFNSSHLSETAVDDISELDKILAEDTFAWIDVQGFGCQKTIQQIGKQFNMHPLLLEDVVNVPQRPKSEAFGDQLLVLVRMPATDREFALDQLEFEQLCLVLGPDYVVTFQERYGDVFDPVRERIRRRNSPITQRGVDYLAYALIDTVVDSYFPLLEQIGDQLEVLENQVVATGNPQMLGTLTRWKNQLTNMRRILWPHRDAINSLVRGDHPIISEDVRLFLRDTHDHTVQTTEVAEMFREMVSSLMNTHLTAVANRTNEVMRVLTIVSTIFIPLTFVAGVYGMNFQNMPELQSPWGYPLVWFLMIGTAVGLTGWFYAIGWLGRRY